VLVTVRDSAHSYGWRSSAARSTPNTPPTALDTQVRQYHGLAQQFATDAPGIPSLPSDLVAAPSRMTARASTCVVASQESRASAKCTDRIRVDVVCSPPTSGGERSSRRVVRPSKTITKAPKSVGKLAFHLVAKPSWGRNKAIDQSRAQRREGSVCLIREVGTTSGSLRRGHVHPVSYSSCH
jgi:hypothetical protein